MSTKYIRVRIPGDIYTDVAHLAVDQATTVGDLVLDAVVEFVGRRQDLVRAIAPRRSSSSSTSGDDE